MTAHEWGKIGRFDLCKVCCRLRVNVEGKPCSGPDRLRPMEGTLAAFPGDKAPAVRSEAQSANESEGEPVA
jgi:hypothetical protein